MLGHAPGASVIILYGMEPVDLSRLAEFGVWFLVFLFSTTMHEAGHALLARLGGDDTAYLGGQVSLNPLPHIRREPLGMILVPIASFFLMGWVMGWASTPYDPYWAQRHPRRHALMSAAGPAANLLLAVLAFVTLFLLLSAGIMTVPEEMGFSHLAEPAPEHGERSLLHPAGMALSVALCLNLLLCIFNLFPIPPLDGSGVIQGIFPTTVGRFLETVRGNPMMGLLGMLVAWRVIPTVFDPLFRQVLALLYGGFL